MKTPPKIPNHPDNFYFGYAFVYMLVTVFCKSFDRNSCTELIVM